MTTLRNFRVRFLLPALAGAAVALSGCDNVGRAFDPDTGSGGGTPTETNIQAMRADGISVEGRPKVTNVFPKGNGWPGTVPIVVVFNETVAEDSVAPRNGEPNLFARVKTTTDPNQGGGGTGGGGTGGGGTGASTPLAATYDFLLGGRVVVIRPSQAFDPTQATTIEIVIKSELRDADGIRFGGSSEKVLEEFTADKSNDIKDGEILTVLPIDNARDQTRQSLVYAIFTKPCTQTSVKATGAGTNFSVRPQGGANLAGAGSFPIDAVGVGPQGKDGRIFEFNPNATLAADTQHEIVVADTITFPESGKLEFKGRTPFARFTTTGAPPPDAVKVGNATTGAADKVNATNVNSLRIDVDVPADTLAGDQVVVRIYGLDKAGGNTGALGFFEAKALAPVAGKQTLGVNFGAQLGTAALPNFLEGPLLFAAYLSRGNRSSGYVLSSTTTNPALDVTPPTLATPALDTSGNRFVFTDQEYLTFFGSSAEPLSAASLILDSTPGPAPNPTNGTTFGFGSGGRFMFEPIFLGRRTTPVGFTLTITDSAGNESPPLFGKIVQRGVVTGAVAPSGVLTIEAYNDATFQPISGATVLIESGLPTKPATGRQTTTTDATGRATFTGLVGASHSITIAKAGYHLVSLLDTAAGFASLPLRPESGATASVRGTAAFTAGTGQTAIVGCNILDDVTREEIFTTTTSPTTIPAATVRPNRPYVLTAFAGTFEPQSNPTFVNFACSICGPTGVVPEAARPPINPSGTGQTTLPLLPAATLVRNLAATYDKDLSTWTGLDTTKLMARPTVRIMASLFGLAQQTLTGVGFATQVGNTATYTIDGGYSAAAALGMLKLLPKFWVSTEATDTTGVVTRHRRIIADLTLGTTFMSAAVPAVLTITAPTAASTDSPAVTYQDRLDVTSVPSTLGFHVLTATNGTRHWRIFRRDKTATAGATTVQLPVLSGVSGGLATGAWKIRADSHLMFSLTMSGDDYLLEEMRREEVTFARTPETTFTVN